jgi:cytochrome b involved in lipid metabolism
MQYSISEIKRHNTENDCWIYTNEIVYNVTQYLDHHPGSKLAILRYAGQNCDSHFKFHSKQGQRIWDQYKIGTIKHRHSEKCCHIL